MGHSQFYSLSKQRKSKTMDAQRTESTEGSETTRSEQSVNESSHITIVDVSHAESTTTRPAKRMRTLQDEREELRAKAQTRRVTDEDVYSSSVQPISECPNLVCQLTPYLRLFIVSRSINEEGAAVHRMHELLVSLMDAENSPRYFAMSFYLRGQPKKTREQHGFVSYLVYYKRTRRYRFSSGLQLYTYSEDDNSREKLELSCEDGKEEILDAKVQALSAAAFFGKDSPNALEFLDTTSFKPDHPLPAMRLCQATNFFFLINYVRGRLPLPLRGGGEKNDADGGEEKKSGVALLKSRVPNRIVSNFTDATMMECCVCFRKTLCFTGCVHPLCRACIVKMDEHGSHECPLCRRPLSFFIYK